MTSFLRLALRGFGLPPAARTALAVALLAYLFVDQVRPVLELQPPVDELTWAGRSFLPWFPGQPLHHEEEWARRFPREYYCYIHHPSVTRLVYRAAFALTKTPRPPRIEYDYGLDYGENMWRGNYLPSGIRVLLRVTNAVFVFAAALLVFFALLGVSGNRALAALATLPIIYEPTITKVFNSAVGYVGADAILLFLIVLFWFAWLRMGDGLGSAAVLGLLGGLATSTKYTGGLLLVAAVAYLALAGGRRRGARALVICAVAAAVFLALNPIYLGASLAWPWKVFKDTVTVTLGLQVSSVSKTAYASWMIADRHEVLLLLLGYLPFALPAAALVALARRARWFGRTIAWSGVIIFSGLIGYILFLPTYAAPCRMAFLVIIMAAALQKIRDWREGRDGDAVATEEPEAPRRAKAGTLENASPGGTWRRMAAAALARLRPWPAFLVAPVVAAAGVFAPAAPEYALAAALPVVVFAGAFAACRGVVKSALVTLSLAAMIPCFECPPATNMVAFSLGAAIFWALTLYLEGRRWGRATVAIAAAASTAALSISPQSFVFAVAAALWLVLRRGRRRPAEATALVLALAVVIAVRRLAAPLAPAGLTSGAMPTLLDWTHADYWNVRAWSAMAHSQAYEWSMAALSQYIYFPAMGAFGVLAYRWRKQRWFAPTFAWGAILFLGARLFSKHLYLQYSLPLELGLLVPFTLVAVMTLGELAGEPAAAKGAHPGAP